jgi:hypothetical protein
MWISRLCETPGMASAYSYETGIGVYLLGDRTPVPAKFRLNKFGHLEVSLVTSGETFSFAR